MKKLVVGIVIATIVYLLWPTGKALIDGRVLTQKNYASDVCALSKEYNVPYSYLMALITQECSGKRPCPSRYEDHVFKRLQAVRDGKKKQMDRNVTHQSISDANDEALVNLATSWGPFQLMGYQSVGMKITVAQIRGEDALKYGIEWIQEDYGHLLKKERYQDSFHWHNAGRTYPKDGKTESAQYVADALTYMEHFANGCK